MDCFVASLLACAMTQNWQRCLICSQLPLVRRVVRLIDGELVHRGLPQMFGNPRRLQIDLAFCDLVRQRACSARSAGHPRRAAAFSRAASAASLPCSSASCRVTRSSALMPTRSLKALWPLICGVISLRRKSATALISSVGVGSSCIIIPLGANNLQQIDLRLRRTAADHRALHRMIRALCETAASCRST